MSESSPPLRLYRFTDGEISYVAAFDEDGARALYTECFGSDVLDATYVCKIEEIPEAQWADCVLRDDDLRDENGDSVRVPMTEVMARTLKPEVLCSTCFG